MIAINENEKLKAYGEAQGIMIGTTLSAMLMYGEHYYIIHVGDSRVYELTTEVTQLTKDQTLVAREVAAGRLTPEQAEKDSRRSILLQCIGASPVVEPDFIRGYIEENACYMLCSDGFRHKISENEMLDRIGPKAVLDENAMREGCAFLTELDKYRKETGDTTKTVIASTASPYKFTRSVMNAIDSKYDSMGDFELVDELSKISNVKVPNAIEEIRTAPVLHDTVCDSDKMCDEVKKILGI